ncbi:hypothetical protein A0H81_11363 [Grifola frondosa]|uniref:AB hydrolase-1 domain-containing protein n=1 Tax=Grifola frondosa TaxID=5627 RepID=A0A1C7LVW2_GRIFR|nr:hypothetical protein A0H81_11363 [Grifola frondosa]
MTTQVKTVTVDGGIEVFYREAAPAGAGNVSTILLLHGFPSSSFQYRNLIPGSRTNTELWLPIFPVSDLLSTIGAFVDALGLEKFAIYIFDYGAPTGLRLALDRPSSVTAIITQNGNAYEEGLGGFWDAIKKYWVDSSQENRDSLRYLMTFDTTKSQYVTGASDPSAIPPETYHLDYYLMTRANNVEIQLDIFFDYRTNVALYPAFQTYFRLMKPPTLAVWGKHDPIFIPPGAEAFKRDNPKAEVKLIDAGHFALESNLDEISNDIVTGVRNYIVVALTDRLQISDLQVDVTGCRHRSRTLHTSCPLGKSSNKSYSSTSTTPSMSSRLAPTIRQGILNLPGTTFEAKLTVERLLEEDRKRHHCFYGKVGFHNHLSHHVLAAYDLGAPAQLLQKIYDKNAKSLSPIHTIDRRSGLEEEQNVSITPQNWKQFLGQEKYYANYVEFFATVIASIGAGETLERYIFSPGANGNESYMLFRFVGGATSSDSNRIRCRIWNDAMVAQALAQTAVHQPFLPEIFNLNIEGYSLLSILQQTYDSPIMKPVMPYDPDAFISARFKDACHDGRPEEIRRLSALWQVDVTRGREGLDEKVEELLWTTTRSSRARGGAGGSLAWTSSSCTF